MRKHQADTPALVIMAAEELTSDTPSDVSIVGDDKMVRACLRNTPPLAAGRWQRAFDALGSTHSRTQPLYTFADDIRGLSCAIWHHGGGAIAVLSGQLDAVLPYTDIPEDEREVLLINSAREAALGGEVLALARIELPAAMTSLEAILARAPLTLIGCIALKCAPNPKAITYARHAQTKGLKLQFITARPLVYAEAIGLQNGLIERLHTAFDAQELLDNPSPSQATKLRAATIIGAISPLTAPLVAQALSGATAHLTPTARSLLGM
ncbi:MAG TPA: hypothetical protein VFQ70_00420 [Candidatus Saccharimonadaceae bacterium]|nr:hypothetical protein [Candidatus Saccharimonadaceae bacterium]